MGEEDHILVPRGHHDRHGHHGLRPDRGRQSGGVPVTASKDKDVMQDLPSSSRSGLIENGMKDNAIASADLNLSERCLDMYNKRHASYLVDKEDSMAKYEKVAKRRREEKLQQQDGAELSFLDKLGHVEKMELLNGIAVLKDEFHGFLFRKKCAKLPFFI
ncbi:hypothetical protein Tsubulata_049181 [Turnera subulata]|uniref:Uncharacterized protein n=1 Tax=Turnera subulata TaxID=218843 RepID=A0A9Q0JD00_9ROSI|nr:hypothetical protein Tsubulata_049181 [Turnera subulata]